jgi:hypothetical protein
MKHSLSAIAATLSLLLAACGGGSSGSAGSSTTPSVAASLTLTGVVAQGAAIANTSVSAKCASGTGSATTASDGRYTLTVSSGTLPCVLEAANGSTPLHSVATGSGSSATAQITPLTELLVAQLTGQTPATYYSSTTTLASDVTSSKVSAAQAAVIATLSAAGLSTSALSELVTGSLSAGSNTGYDGVLEALQTTLNATGTSLSTLTSTVAALAEGASGASSSTANLTLPADLLLRAKASNCDALRSTTYRAVMSHRNGAAAVVHFSVDTAKQLITDLDNGGTEIWTPNGNCRYTSSLGHDIVVSPAGVIVARLSSSATANDTSNTYYLLVGVPEQTHTLAEVAGTWNTIGLDTDDSASSWYAYYATATVTATGARTINTACQYAATTATKACATGTSPNATFAVATSGGGFLATATSGNDVERVYLYRSGSGDLFFINANQSTRDVAAGDGSISFGTLQRSVSLPSVANVNKNWNVTISTANQLSGSAIESMTHTVQSVDSSAGSFTRLSGTSGGATHSETININTPLTGFSSRVGAAGVSTSDGSTTTVREFVSFKAAGMGLSVNYLPVTNGSSAKLAISVSQ